MTLRECLTGETSALADLVLVLALLPNLATSFFVNFVMTQTLILGLAAATIVFLAKYGGMTSLAQLLMFGIAGFMFGNAALDGGAEAGLRLFVANGFREHALVAAVAGLGEDWDRRFIATRGLIARTPALRTAACCVQSSSNQDSSPNWRRNSASTDATTCGCWGEPAPDSIASA
jgi:hypothetical protein